MVVVLGGLGIFHIRADYAAIAGLVGVLVMLQAYVPFFQAMVLN